MIVTLFGDSRFFCKMLPVRKFIIEQTNLILMQSKMLVEIMLPLFVHALINICFH